MYSTKHSSIGIRSEFRITFKTKFRAHFECIAWGNAFSMKIIYKQRVQYERKLKLLQARLCIMYKR